MWLVDAIKDNGEDDDEVDDDNESGNDNDYDRRWRIIWS